MKKGLLTAILAAAGLAGAVEPDQAACPISPWDQGQREIAGSPALPIRYSTPFTREREMLGYRPRFLPGMLTFTPGNRPVMRIGVADASQRGLHKHTVAPRTAGPYFTRRKHPATPKKHRRPESSHFCPE